jgi:hypothetical protein
LLIIYLFTVTRCNWLTLSYNELLEHLVAMKKSLFVLIAFSLLSCSCSTIGLVYRNADWYLEHKINGYTSFNTSQKETIHKEVAIYISWHRKIALPEYIIFLQNLNGTAQYDGQLKAKQITLLRAKLLNLYRQTLAPSIQPLAKLFSSMNSRQITELNLTFAENIQKQKEEILGGNQDKNLDKRADKTVDFLEWLAGNLSNEQEQKIRGMSRSLPFVSHIYIQQLETNQGKLISLLNDHAGSEAIAAFLTTWMLTSEVARTPLQQRDIQAYEDATDEMIARIHGLLTDQQKDHMHKVISSYIKDMQILTTDTHPVQ